MWNRHMRTSSLRAGVGGGTLCTTSVATQRIRTTVACPRHSPISTSIKQVMIPGNAKTLPQTQCQNPRRAKRRLTAARPESLHGCRMLVSPGLICSCRGQRATGEVSSLWDVRPCFLWLPKAQNTGSVLGRFQCIFNNG